MEMLTQVFKYNDNPVRTEVINSDVWFLLKDVCAVLDLGNHNQVKARLEGGVISTYPIQDALGRTQQATFVNEDGLYDVILDSRKPEAKAFRKWITSEVLPAIRKTGSYSLQVPQTFSEALMLAAELQKKIEEDQPKIEAHDRFISGANHQKMADVAKVLGFGRNTLFKMLREAKILMANNTPYQRYIDQGYFVVKETPVTMGGETINKPQTYVTAKGVEWLARKLGQNKKPLLAQ